MLVAQIGKKFKKFAVQTTFFGQIGNSGFILELKYIVRRKNLKRGKKSMTHPWENTIISALDIHFTNAISILVWDYYTSLPMTNQEKRAICTSMMLHGSNDDDQIMRLTGFQARIRITEYYSS